MRIEKNLEKLGVIDYSKMRLIFPEVNDALTMIEKYEELYNRNNVLFYNHLSDIDKAKVDKYLKQTCPKCGYPTFKKYHEEFLRCEGCNWKEEE